MFFLCVGQSAQCIFLGRNFSICEFYLYSNKFTWDQFQFLGLTETLYLEENYSEILFLLQKEYPAATKVVHFHRSLCLEYIREIFILFILTNEK